MTSGSDELRPQQVDVLAQGIEGMGDLSQRRKLTPADRRGRRGIGAARAPPSFRDSGYLGYIIPNEAMVEQKTRGNPARQNFYHHIAIKARILSFRLTSERRQIRLHRLLHYRVLFHSLRFRLRPRPPPGRPRAHQRSRNSAFRRAAHRPRYRPHSSTPTAPTIL